MALGDRSALPATIGPYRLEECLGSGGMGEVYRAHDERLRRRVAIKHILAPVAEKPNLRQRFRREAKTVAGLNHSAIVKIYDLLETEEGDWIVMELVEGRTIRELMRSGELTLPLTLRLAREISDGLAVAHAKGIVHRDLKVENVMVSENHHASAGRAKILDFGLAKRLEKRDPGETTLSGVGVVVGTFRTMAPEQITEQEVDGRSDLFSLGTMLYEMCTGQSPFRAGNMVATMARVCRHQQPPAITLVPDLPEELSDFIDELLQKDPDQRPQSAVEVVRFFDQLLGEANVAPVLGKPSGHDGSGSASELTPTAPMETTALEALRIPRPRRVGGIEIKTLLATDVAVEPGGEAGDALTRLAALRRELAALHRGREIDFGGGPLLVFERPATAIRFALAYHQRAAGVRRETGVPVTVRTGIHLGEVTAYTGPLEERTRIAEGEEDLADEGAAFAVETHTPRVARGVMSLARPGQILYTQVVDELVRHSTLVGRFGEHDVRRRHRGLHRLPELGEDVEVFEVGTAGEGSMWRGRAWALAAAAASILVVGFLLLRGCAA